MTNNILKTKTENEEKLLAISMPHTGTFKQELSHLFWRIQLPEEYKPIYLAAKSTDLVTARNSLLKASLDEERVEYILFIDSDQVVAPSVPRRMLQRAEEDDIRVLGALTFIWKKNLPIPLLPRSEGGDGREEYNYSWIEETGLVRTQRVGTGVLLLHRSVFDEIEKPYFMNSYDEWGIRDQAEDFYLSQKLDQADIPMYIDSNIVCGHIKNIDLKDVVSLLDWAIQAESEEEFLRGF